MRSGSQMLLVYAVADIQLTDIATLYLTTPSTTNLPSILQFSSEDKYTKYEICELFAEIMGLPLSGSKEETGMRANTEGNKPGASVQRPYDCHLSTKVLKDLAIDCATMDFVGWWRRESRAFRK